MSSLATLALDDTSRADDVLLNDNARASALSDSKPLQRTAIALLIYSGATGNLTYVDGNGRTRVLDVTKWAAGVWHLVKIRQVMTTGTTVAATNFELGWSRY
jgi:hypothetical protein